MTKKSEVLDTPDAKAALELIRSAQTLVLTTHEGPDGDGIGSELALTRALRRAGKRVYVVNSGDCARAFKFLDSGSDVIVWNEAFERTHPSLFDEVDLAVLIDTAELERTGQIGRRLASRKGPVVTIDHHLANERSIAGVVGPDFTSTGELMALVIDELGLPLTKDIATALYGAMLSDTQQFRFCRQDPDVFTLAARLVQAGADPQDIARKMFGTMTRDKLVLMSRIFAATTFECKGRLAWSDLTPETTADISVDRDDIRSMVNMIGDLEGVEISVLFKVFKKGSVKVSIRAKEMHISDVAESLGGGGHSQAAGADVEGEIDVVREKTLAMLRKKFDQARRTSDS